jgi:hypothetical protein
MCTKNLIIDTDFREAPSSELIMIEPVDPIVYTNSNVSFECQAIKFLFAKPYIYFQLILNATNGSEPLYSSMETGNIIMCIW